MNKKKIALVSLGSFIILLSGYLFFIFMERNIPTLTIVLENTYIKPSDIIYFHLQDKGRGLKDVRVYFLQKEKNTLLLEKYFDGGVFEWDGELVLADLPDGVGELVFVITDRSLNNLGKGNAAIFRQKIVLDGQPPKFTLFKNTQWLRQGGAGIVSYALSEEVNKTGVTVGDNFFPAFPQADGTWLCLFSYPYFADIKSDKLRLLAVDRAGNEQTGRFFYTVAEENFPHDTLHISEHFLEKVVPQFQHYFPQEENLYLLYLKINNLIREENNKTIFSLREKTDNKKLWNGKFLRLQNSIVKASFGDKRTYVYNKQSIDEQVHLGVDFASVVHAPVQAANNGKVVFVGDIGIYGNVVVVDHGLGLQSLYAHLSQIDVEVDSVVKKGQIIGKTGTTGMSFGDHLHLCFFVNGIAVNPVEWFDVKWVENNIDKKIYVRSDDGK